MVYVFTFCFYYIYYIIKSSDEIILQGISGKNHTPLLSTVSSPSKLWLSFNLLSLHDKGLSSGFSGSWKTKLPTPPPISLSYPSGILDSRNTNTIHYNTCIGNFILLTSSLEQVSRLLCHVDFVWYDFYIPALCSHTELTINMVHRGCV